MIPRSPLQATQASSGCVDTYPDWFMLTASDAHDSKRDLTKVHFDIPTSHTSSPHTPAHFTHILTSHTSSSTSRSMCSTFWHINIHTSPLPHPLHPPSIHIISAIVQHILTHYLARLPRRGNSHDQPPERCPH